MTGSLPSPDTGAYGLPMPTWRDARESLERVYGPAGAAVWERLVRQAGTAAHDHGRESLERVLAVMAADGDPVVTLCGSSMLIRLASYDHLSAVHAAIRRSQS